jgi:hypothetical protein
MSLNHSRWWVAGLLLLSLLLAGCESATPGQGLPTSTLAESVLQSPLVPPTAAPTSTLKPTSAPEPTPTLALTAAPVQLTVLHTNDDWGETEPCG